jgi:predicted transcriptional regulator
MYIGIVMSTTTPADDVRDRAEWMNPVDDQILELLEEEGNMTPRGVEHFGVTVSDHAGDRLSKLAEYGLVERITRGLYRITDEGLRYLEGNLNASTLDPVDD